MKKNKVSESIYSDGSITIPMADVMFIEKHFYGNPSKYSGILIIMKDTKWDMEADTWSNNAFISNHKDLDKKFLNAWCYYRHELEGGEDAFKTPDDFTKDQQEQSK